MFAPFKNLLLASAISFAAVAAEETNNVKVAPLESTRAVVNCPGITGVPMTADAEQSLPLQLVGTLKCGSTVSILVDTANKVSSR